MSNKKITGLDGLEAWADRVAKYESDREKHWIDLSTEERYQWAYEGYRCKYPHGTLSDFHLMEIELLENRLKDPAEYPMNPKFHHETNIKFIVELRKLLQYYKAKEAAHQKGNNTNNTEPKINHSITGAFCYLVWCTELIEKGPAESSANYCKRVCEAYPLLNYADRVRQNFAQGSRANINFIKELILPKIPTEHSLRITEYLQSKEKK